VFAHSSKFCRSPNPKSDAPFRREVHILGGLDIPGIPRLIESNVAHAADKSYELFLAAEFIVGRRLKDVVADGSMPASSTVELTLKRRA